ncbi:MAG: YidC/Oxa1 family membrane protein insertase [Solirubrobacteraceae bacterium]
MPILANVIQDAFSPLISVFEEIMVFIHAHVVGGSWGLAIVGLTVLIRAVLVPLTYKQLKSMQEMQRHAPELSALKEKYKDDKQRQQQEMMKFYQERGINPLASCLPLLLQLPVFVSLFYMLRTDLKKHICGPALTAHHIITSKAIEKATCSQVEPHSHAAKFLFIPDITSKATGVVLVVLIVLYVGSQLASTLIATATADPNQRRLMLLLPVVFVVILYRYPAGLLVYWITTNLWTVGQQSVIRRRIGPAPPRAPSPKDSSNGRPSGPVKPALAGAGVGAADAGGGKTTASPRPSSPPPAARKKKKRSGRRR